MKLYRVPQSYQPRPSPMEINLQLLFERDRRCLVNMKVVLIFIASSLVGLGECIVKRQVSCINTRQFAASTCQGITDFENLFTVSGSTITPFGSVLDRIAERGDSRSVINEICTSQSCFSRLETLYSSCMVHYLSSL